MTITTPYRCGCVYLRTVRVYSNSLPGAVGAQMTHDEKTGMDSAVTDPSAQTRRRDFWQLLVQDTLGMLQVQS